jgi:hypothetical protein
MPQRNIDRPETLNHSKNVHDDKTLESETEFLEQPKTAITKHSRLILWNTFIHFLPIAITASILALNLKTTYWRDIGGSGTNSILNALQYAAKVHEMFMCASLSLVVLHFIQYELVNSRGIALGFAMAGYRLSDLAFLASSEFRGGFTAHPSHQLGRSTKLLLIRLLIVVAFLLTAVVGPSAAIVVLPRLDWWDVDSPFGTSGTIYTDIEYNDMWPQLISKDLVPADCQNSSSQDSLLNHICPSAGYDTINVWVKAYMEESAQPNITMMDSDGSNAARFLTSTYGSDMRTGWIVTSSVGNKQARDLFSFWQYAKWFSRELSSITRPLVTPFLLNGKSYMKPLVQVDCSLFPANASSISFPHGHLTTPPFDKVADEDWGVQSPMISQLLMDANRDGLNTFTWVDMSSYSDIPSIGAIFALSSDNYTDIIVPCTIDARWVPVTIWLDPENDPVVAQDSPDLGVLLQTMLNAGNLLQDPMIISTEWADFLSSGGAAVLVSPSPVNHTIPGLIQYLGFDVTNKDTNETIWAYGPGLPVNEYVYPISTMLGMYLTDALTRVKTEPISALYSPVLNHSGSNGVVDLNSINFGNINGIFEEDALENGWKGWTAYNYAIHRNGYGWGLKDFTSKLASSILLLQAFIGLMYVAVLWWSKWRCNSWRTMGELLVLAINSQPTYKLAGTSAGVQKTTTWKQILYIREAHGGHLEIVMDGSGLDSSVRVIEAEKKYS